MTTTTEKPRKTSGDAVLRSNKPWVLLRGIAGGIVGGAIGFFVFQWLARRNLYGMMIPGAMIGLAAGLAARGRSVALGILCVVGAVALAVFAEWYMFPFVKDESFSYFLRHLHQKSAIKLIMMGLGAAFAYWLGQGRELP
jgi:hypothetical protein